MNGGERAAAVADLRRAVLLADLPDEVLEHLAAASARAHLAPGELLLRQGQVADTTYVIVSGAVEVFAEVDGASVPLAVSGPGDLVGEMALIAGRTRSASARALDAVEVLCIDGAAFAGWLDSPVFTRRLLVAASQRLEQRQLLTQQHTKMAALGQLTAGLLHELNNPTAALRRNAELLHAALEQLRSTTALLQPDASALVREVTSAARRDAAPMDALDRSDAEQQLQRWLTERDVVEAWALAPVLVNHGLAPEALEALTGGLQEAAGLGDVLRAASVALEVDALLEGLLAASQRISETVAAVQAYSHHGEAPVQDVDVADGLERALALLVHKTSPDVQVVRDYAPALPRIEGHPGDLNSVWTNLLDNALDAVGSSGTITVRVRADRARVVVEVGDDGPGIDPQIRSRIFDPFFTTKPVGQGTGVGLALARTIIVQRHGGDLSVDSAPGRTVFRVSLPVRQATPAESSGGDGAGGAGGAGAGRSASARDGAGSGTASS